MKSYKYNTTLEGKQAERYAIRCDATERSENNKAMLARGFVRVFLDPYEDDPQERFAWEKKKHSVFDSKRGCWRRKIDYVCQYLGGKAVESEIRTVKGLEKEGAQALMSTSDWIPQYRKKLNELVSLVETTLSGKF